MTDMERMLAGQPYIAQGDEIIAAMVRARRLLWQFNSVDPWDTVAQNRALQALFGHIGKDSTINQSFRCDYGVNITIGDNCFFNYDCVIIDVCPVTIGDNVLFGPRVCLCTAAHPIDARVRASRLEYGMPIVVGDDVWIGTGAIVNPGVTIGSDVVIGAGSVVTKDIPSHVVAVGNPCRVLRTIDEEDRAHWQDQLEAYRRSMNG